MIQMKPFPLIGKCVLLLLPLLAAACGGRAVPTNYHDPQMDFSTLRVVAVMPLANLTRDQQAAERARDTFMSSLMATGVVYVIPAGEVARGISRAGIADPLAPSDEEVGKLAAIISADAVITGAVREYNEVRSGTTSANIVSMSLELFEAKTQKVVWAASSTKGGITM
jgi:hypothetical protein